jgi:uncharacterized protein (TIGR02246 family)
MTTDEQAIRDVVATWIAATRGHDTATVLRLVADDVVFLTAGNPPMRKAEFAAAQGAQRDLTIDARADIREISVHGDVAWMWTDLDVVVTPNGGAPVTRSGPALTVLRKESRGWVIARDANMVAPSS